MDNRLAEEKREHVTFESRFVFFDHIFFLHANFYVILLIFYFIKKIIIYNHQLNNLNPTTISKLSLFSNKFLNLVKFHKLHNSSFLRNVHVIITNIFLNFRKIRIRRKKVKDRFAYIYTCFLSIELPNIGFYQGWYFVI